MVHPTKFLEDLSAGQSFDLGHFAVREAEMVDFALKFDPQPLHTDTESPAAKEFGGIIASGMFTTSIAVKLFSEGRLFGENPMLGRGVDALRWPHPVRAGDVLHGTARVLDVAPSGGRGRRGTVRLRLALTRASGEIVLEMEPLIILPGRGTAPVEAMLRSR